MDWEKRWRKLPWTEGLSIGLAQDPGGQVGFKCTCLSLWFGKRSFKCLSESLNFLCENSTSYLLREGE